MATDGSKLTQLPELTTLSDDTMLYAVNGGEDYHVNFETIKDGAVPEVFTPTTDGLVPHPNSGNGGKVLRGDGTWQGTFDSSNDGLVPKLGTNDKDNVLRGDGTWVTNDKLIGTGSGSLVTFDAIEAPMPKLKASIVAKQASGVPSPSNPLPISGWDAVVVSDVGKNLLPPTELSGTRNGITVTTVKDANDRIIGYSFSGTATAQTDFYVKTELNMDVGTNRIYSIRESEISGLTGMILPSYDRTTTNRVTNKAISSFVIRIDNGTVLNNAIVNPMICNESEGTTFVPYNGVTTTISLAQTVYGGEVDVVNGVLKITHLYEEFDETATVSFGRNGESNWYYVINGNTADASVLPISNMYVGASIGNNNDNLGICKVTNGQIRVRVGGTQPATVDDFVTALGTQHLQVLSVLATPTTIPLTPSLIKSLNGINNLSVDSGEVIEVEYQRSITEAINALEAGGGYSETSLWSNSSGVYTGSLALSDSIENYNALMFKVSNAQGWANFDTVPTSALASNNAKVGIGGGMQSAVWWFQFTRTDATHITINNNSSTNDKLYEIIGIKY